MDLLSIYLARILHFTQFFNSVNKPNKNKKNGRFKIF